MSLSATEQRAIRSRLYSVLTPLRCSEMLPWLPEETASILTEAERAAKLLEVSTVALPHVAVGLLAVENGPASAAVGSAVMRLSQFRSEPRVRSGGASLQINNAARTAFFRNPSWHDFDEWLKWRDRVEPHPDAAAFRQELLTGHLDMHLRMALGLS